jgi:hypothetical protein
MSSQAAVAFLLFDFGRRIASQADSSRRCAAPKKLAAAAAGAPSSRSRSLCDAPAILGAAADTMLWRFRQEARGFAGYDAKVCADRR